MRGTFMNPEWRKCEPDEIVEERWNFRTGEVVQKTAAQMEEEWRADFMVKRFWNAKRIWCLNWTLGYRRYL